MIDTIYEKLGGLRRWPGALCARFDPHSEQGLTLIEVLVATVILTIGLLGTFGLLNTSAKTSAQTHDREGAVSLVRQILEDARTIPFAQLTPTSVTTELQAMQGLANSSSSGSTWQIVRDGSNTQQGTTYTVTVKECSIDDPKDGLAKELSTSEAETFCEKHQGNEEWKTGDAVDTAPVDFKRVTAKVSWSVTGRSPYVEQTTLIGAAGEPVGLSSSELKLISPTVSSPTQPTITESSVKELTFAITTSSSASAARWSLEGVPQSPAPTLKEGSTWTFKWKIESISDGTYQVSAQATSSTGVLGAPLSIPVTLIRGEPAEPKGVKGGFNEVYVNGVRTRAIELKWEANSERNVIGYRVYSPKGLACPGSTSELSTSLSCMEVPTEYASGSTPSFTVAALYRNAKGEVAEGKKATFKVSSPSNPNPPTGLTATKNEDGSVTLKWQAPTSGPSPLFYWVYRVSSGESCPVGYSNRYSSAFVAEGSEPSFTDTDGSVVHTYCVTSVSSTLTESSAAGPVSG